MPRATIDFGIHFGVTESSIAVLKGTEVLAFKNNYGNETTPNVVWIDKKDKLYVGKIAKDRLEDDPENAYSEFLLTLGTDQEYVFQRSGRRMRPEELAAKVLEELIDSVRKTTHEDIEAAVITIPVDFDACQCNAMLNAARIAGLKESILLQEPVAAVLAYGLTGADNNSSWLVYNLGSGSFEASIVKAKEGEIRVVNHSRDNFLCGKLMNWSIVEKLLIPVVVREYRLNDFSWDNPRWRSAIA